MHNRHLFCASRIAVFADLSLCSLSVCPWQQIPRINGKWNLEPSSLPHSLLCLRSVNKESLRSFPASTSTSVFGGCGSWQWGMPSLNSPRVIWPANYMQRLRSLKEGLTCMSPGKCQQMTLSPLEQSLVASGWTRKVKREARWDRSLGVTQCRGGWDL